MFLLQNDTSLRFNRTVRYYLREGASEGKPYVWAIKDGYPLTAANLRVH